MIPWEELISEGVVTEPQADELRSVIVRNYSGAWTFNLDMRKRPRDETLNLCQRVILAVCAPERATQ